MFKNILLAVDGSQHSLKAADLAADMGRLNQAKLCIVVVFDPVPAYLGEPFFQQAVFAHIKEANTIMEQAITRVGDIPKGIKTEVLEGPPAEAILEISKTRKNDLIVMGTRGLGRLSAIFLGSQSQKVVAHAQCPVLLVR